MESRFHEIDDLVLHLKGLVLVRELLETRGAGADQIDVHSAEIERVRARLAEVVSQTAEQPAYGLAA
jgi:hypothetical protein